MIKKLLLTLLVVTLSVTAGVAGTLAYLQDEDSDVNVMTVGNVYIEQHEYERDGNGTKEIDGRTSYVLKDFTQAKPLYPIVGDPSVPGDDPAYAGWDDTVVRMSQVDSYGSVQVFAGKNAQDKIVTVENTGKSDAYVRSVVAIEIGETDGTLIGINKRASSDANSTAPWLQDALYGVEINGNNYMVYEFVYRGAADVNRHVNGVLPAGDTTYPSLCQVYLRHTATNEDMDKIDGNGNGTLEIMVLSQAVQVEGFANAETALDTAFGTFNEENVVEWFSDVREEVEVSGNNKVALLDAIESARPGSAIVLTEDTLVAGYAATEKLVIDKNVIIDLNGHTLTTECGWGGIDLKGGASIINGTINHTGNTAAIKVFNAGKIENVTINVTETAGKTKGGIVIQNQSGNRIDSIKNVTINGATNGIELYRSADELAIGSMENVVINATSNGIFLNGAGKIGKISNCDINGGNIGIQGYLANLWNISLDIENSKISGGTTGVDIWDEGAVNTGSMVTFNYDSASVFSGSRENIKVTLQEEITCTINGVAQTTPCDVRIK